MIIFAFFSPFFLILPFIVRHMHTQSTIRHTQAQRHIDNDRLRVAVIKKPAWTGKDKTAVAAHYRSTAHSFVNSLQRHIEKCEVCTDTHAACAVQVCSLTWKEANIHELKYILQKAEGLWTNFHFSLRAENKDIYMRNDVWVSKVDFHVMKFHL